MLSLICFLKLKRMQVNMKKFMQFLLFITLLFSSTFILAQSGSAVGKWKTIDDETGKEKSVVEIYKKDDGKYYGKIIKLFNPDKQDAVCDKCDEEDPRFNQKVLGMEILTEMELDEEDQEYEDGEILDPNNGKVYDCKLWVEDGKLQVRGYVLFFHRTQEWLPWTE